MEASTAKLDLPRNKSADEPPDSWLDSIVGKTTARTLVRQGVAKQGFAFFCGGFRSKAIGWHRISVSFRELLSFIRRI
jgi:hypothetical protein